MLTQNEFRVRLAMILDDQDISNECVLAFYLAHYWAKVPYDNIALCESVVWC